MRYAALVEVYSTLEETAGTREKTEIIASAFREADEAVLPILVQLVRGTVAANWESTDLGMSTALTSRAISRATGIAESRIEEWWREEGDLGNAAATAVAEKTQQTLFSDPLTVEAVYETLQDVASFSGSGSQERRVDTIAGLIADAEPDEARYLVRTIVGAMRLGVGDGIVRDAIASAFLDGSDEAIAAVGHASDVTNDFRVVIEQARSGDQGDLRALDIELFRPIKPMLAHKASSLEAGIEELADARGEVLLETKYDGIRAKLHRDPDELRVYTRRLEDVTTQFPDVVEQCGAAIDAETSILEAEIVGYDPETGSPVPFQVLGQRIKRKYDIEAIAADIPVAVYLFDLLLLDGDSLLEAPLRERRSRLSEIVTPEPQSVERAAHVRTSSRSAAESFYDRVIQEGHEGVMIKNLDATYQPGARVGYQLKVKPTMETLDLVVTRAKWSEGRKSEYLGRPYLACYDEERDTFREVGRMHTGFTDDQLEEFHDLVEPLIQDIDGREATLTPEVVLEVAFDEIQESPKYGSGYALRFPRLKQIRPDLGPEEADTFARVEARFESQT